LKYVFPVLARIFQFYTVVLAFTTFKNLDFLLYQNKFNMLKNYFPFLVGLLLAHMLAAQNSAPRPLAAVPHSQPQVVVPFMYPFEGLVPNLADPHPLTQSGVNYRDPEEVAGTTRWDAQSYGCMSQRIYANAAGEPVANWLYGQADPNFGDRGTGHNVRSGGNWPAVNQRVEIARTGFPAAVQLGDGTEVIISHNTGVNPFKLWMARKSASATNWTETALPAPAGTSMLWPKVAVGGPNNMTIHVIGLTAPVGGSTLGTVYQGLNGHILYYRSTDGGLSWDKQNVIIPGLDNSRYTGFSADSYTIDASGDGVAIAVFPNWNDVRVFKSTDNGSNWSNLQVLDFPDALENYDPVPGLSYTIADVPLDTLAPDSLALRTNDGFGAVLIDASQEVHVWFGRMYVVDDNFTDSLSSVYPGTNGLFYWNESRGANNLDIITGAFDYTGNNAVDIATLTEVARYGNGNISSFPTVGEDADGTIYLVYAALDERYRTGEGADVDQFFRRLYAMKTTDGGDHWGDAKELSVDPYVYGDLVPYIECVYPVVPRHIGNQLWVLYQQDFLPGSIVWSVNPTGHQDNSIVWVAVDKDSIPAAVPVGTLEPAKADPDFALRIAPNPASTSAFLSVQLRGTAPARLEMFDLLGRSVQQLDLGTVGGRPSIQLSVQHLPAGTYWIRVTEGARFGLTKLLVR